MTSPTPGMDRESQRLLTPAELELMTVLWDDGPATVREVLDRLPDGKEPAYTTVSTILRILEQKGFVGSSKQGRSHVYAPSLARRDYEGRNLRQLIGSLFGGDPSALARRLVDDEALGDEDLRELQRIVDERLKR